MVTSKDGTKLLGIPVIGGTGKGTAIAVKQLIDDWNVSTLTKSMTFDTASVNTGKCKGAAVEVQKLVGKEWMWAPCRYHIGETFIRHTFEQLQIECSSSPQITLFMKFKNEFYSLTNADDFNTLVYMTDSKRGHIEYDQIILALENALDCKHPRDDYKELIELSLTYLGKPPARFKFRKPGAIHRAGWMAKLIYATKMVLLMDQIQ